MGLKKIAKKMQSALDADTKEKKRTKKIGKLVEKLGKMKKKLKGQLERADNPSKKEALKRKAVTCDTELAKGRTALAAAASYTGLGQKPARVVDKTQASKKPVKKTDETTEGAAQSSPVRH